MQNRKNLRSAIESLYKLTPNFGKPGPTCEMQVRYSLIDPILRAIGWDLEDPDCTLVEFNPGDGTRKRRDYTLFVNRKPVLIVESKCWGELSPAHKANQDGRPEDIKGYKQVLEYCTRNPVRMGIISDGGCWVILRLHPNKKVQKPVIVLDIDGDKTGLGYEKTVNKMIRELGKFSPKKLLEFYDG